MKTFGTISILLLSAFFWAPPSSFGAVSVRLDYAPTVSPLALRELNDGQWLFGLSKDNVLHLDSGGVQRAHAGIFMGWNAEHGNASAGPILGVDIPVGLAEAVGGILSKVGLAQIWKPVDYLNSVASLNGFGGYRPIHTADVNGQWVYGVAATMRIQFGMTELQKGL